MPCNCIEGLSVVSELVEHLALELRFTLSEFELHEAWEAVSALQLGVDFLKHNNHTVPFVASALIDDATKNRH